MLDKWVIRRDASERLSPRGVDETGPDHDDEAARPVADRIHHLPRHGASRYPGGARRIGIRFRTPPARPLERDGVALPTDGSDGAVAFHASSGSRPVRV